jgi:ketosteroid isomerase-like protein
MNEFYAEDTVMEEPAYGATNGLAANIEREKKFLDSVKEWKGFEVTAIGIGDDVTFFEHTMDWIDTNDQPVHVEQVSVARWRDGRIVHERFYYDMR